MVLDKKRNATLIVTPKREDVVYKSFSNFGNVAIDEVRNLNPVEVLKYKYIVIVDSKNSIEILSSKNDNKEKIVKDVSGDIKKDKVNKEEKIMEETK